MNDYLQLIKERPDLFVNPDFDSLIRIETDPIRIRSIEKKKAEELARKGLPAESAKVGIVYHDQYLMILRDAVTFPNGITGTYIRTISETKNNHGVAILPSLKDKWVLLEHFRHATRNLEIEIPRGFGELGISVEQNAMRELTEEIGCSIVSIHFLGTMVENSGFSEAETYIYLADIDSIGIPDKAEGIEKIVFYDTSELIKMIKDNRIKDSYTVFAVLKACLLGYMQF